MWTNMSPDPPLPLTHTSEYNQNRWRIERIQSLLNIWIWRFEDEYGKETNVCTTFGDWQAQVQIFQPPPPNMTQMQNADGFITFHNIFGLLYGLGSTWNVSVRDPLQLDSETFLAELQSLT